MTQQAETTAPTRSIFNGERQIVPFSRVKHDLPTVRMEPSSQPFSWPRGADIALPETYEHKGRTLSVQELIESTDTVALLVIHDGVVRYEDYRLTGGPEVQWISMSVAKSFVSTLVGIAHEEGHIPDLDAAVSDFVPVQPGSAYDAVSIRDVLRMSSGARWNEDYSDPTSDIAQLGFAVAGIDGASLDSFIASMVREADPGTICRYNSAETQVLASLVAHATGTTVAAYMQEKLSEPLGMESAGYWMVDATGTEQCYAGLNLTARDFAKLGELFRNGGVWQGKRIVSEEWVRLATTVDADIRKAGAPIVGGHPFELGYGYQWWIPEGDRGEFSAIGVYNQFVFVDPASDAVIVKLSANPRYGLSEDDDDLKDIETVSFLRAISQSL